MQATEHSPPISLLGHPPTLAVILGDFGRDAGIQLAASLGRAERALIQGFLGSGTPFFDEYRRLTMTLTGDLPFCKQRRLGSYREEGVPLDSRILVGFPDGVALEEVIPRLGVLALEAMRGPLQRGRRDVVVLARTSSR